MIQLQPVHRLHAALLSGMHGICFTEIWSPQSMGQILDMPGCGGWLAVDGDSLTPSLTPPGPAGFVLWRAAADEAEILSIAVLPPWRNQGLGRLLLQSAMDQLAQAKIAALFLEVAEENIAARTLYQSCGLVQVGVRKGYYQGKNALILRSHL